MMNIELKVLNKEFYKTQDNHEQRFNKQELPNYATTGSAGIDLVCTEDVIIYPGEVKAIHTGLAVWIGSGNSDVAGIITPRSGLGTKGLVLANTIGVIDEDYQGELIVQAWNRLEEITYPNYNYLKLKAGDKFAQLVFVPVVKAQFNIVEEFSNETERGTGSFGSTSS